MMPTHFRRRSSRPDNLWQDPEQEFSYRSRLPLTISLLLVLLFAGCSQSCKTVNEPRDVRPLVMHDVPANRLAFRFQPDTGSPAGLKPEDVSDKLDAIQRDFNTNRLNEALLRTVASPDGRRILALYGTVDEPTEAFRIDLYSDDGKFVRNLTPPELACVFPATVAWSPDGNHITFIAHRSSRVTPSPTPAEDVPDIPPQPSSSGAPTPQASPSIAPLFAPVALFATEQIYIANRDGNDLKPLTAREGLIYFYFSWAPDNHALVALACKEAEWLAREKEFKQPAGRPRLLELSGKERLLDDQLAEALPVWSPDAAKVATAFGTDVGIYDAATNRPSQARIPLHDALLAASIILEQSGTTGAKSDNKTQPVAAGTTPASEDPPSFNPIVRLEWPAAEKLYLKTAYVRRFSMNELTNNFQRWHLIMLSPQAAILK